MHILQIVAWKCVRTTYRWYQIRVQRACKPGHAIDNTTTPCRSLSYSKNMYRSWTDHADQSKWSVLPVQRSGMLNVSNGFRWKTYLSCKRAEGAAVPLVLNPPDHTHGSQPIYGSSYQHAYLMGISYGHILRIRDVFSLKYLGHATGPNPTFGSQPARWFKAADTFMHTL